MNYYLVDAQFGHVGRNKYIVKTVAVIAENGKEAAYKVRWIPRAKHDRKDAILNVQEVDYEKYLNVKENNLNDLYFQVKSKQEQRRLCNDINKDIILYESKIAPQTRTKDNLNYKRKKQKEIMDDLIYVMKNHELIYSF